MNIDVKAMANARNFIAARSPRPDLLKSKNSEPIDVNDCVMEFSIGSPNSKNDSHAKNMSMLMKLRPSELKERTTFAITGPRASNYPVDKFAQYKGLIKPPPLDLKQIPAPMLIKEERRLSDVVRTQSKSMVPNEEEDEKKEVQSVTSQRITSRRTFRKSGPKSFMTRMSEFFTKNLAKR